ncbi:hypothetical protein V5R04_01315 [Jonesiaceae bacterium BS-20]|uniref:Uncharacterized protein n=1 Tax=Jonesiaceae bacterium BS-20 TaxID=3120821 RepID=A0AAU7DW01_9MICO
MVTSLFAYDAEGSPLTQVQLVGQDGGPIVVLLGRADINFDSGQVWIRQAHADAYGRSVNNVFPATSWLVPEDPQYCTPEDEEMWVRIFSKFKTATWWPLAVGRCWHGRRTTCW